MDNITSGRCHELLGRLEALVFTDYQLVYKFVDHCKPDITRLRCGRITTGDSDDDDKDNDEQTQVMDRYRQTCRQAGSRRGSRLAMLCTYTPSTSLETKLQPIPAMCMCMHVVLL